MPTPPRNPRRNRPASPFRLLDGKIYILLLDGVAQSLDERLLVEKANEYSRALGHIATYTLFAHGARASFDPAYLDKNDNYAIVGQTASQVRLYFRERQLKKSGLNDFFKQAEQQRNPSGTGSPWPDRNRLSEASSVGKLAGLSVQIAREHWRSRQATAEARLRLAVDARVRYVPKLEELLALAMIHEIGHNRNWHRHTIAEAAVGFLRDKLLAAEGFDTALNSPVNLNLIARIDQVMADSEPTVKDPREEPSMHERHRDPADDPEPPV